MDLQEIINRVSYTLGVSGKARAVACARSLAPTAADARDALHEAARRVYVLPAPASRAYVEMAELLTNLEAKEA